MNDEETVALIAGGHTFGKTHGAADPDEYVGPEPEGAPLEEQGLGWKNSFGTGKGARRDHQRPRGHLDHHPDAVGQQLLREPVRLRVGADRRARPAPTSGSRRTAPARTPCPDRDDGSPTRPPTMLTTDLALRFDPIYEPISRRFHEQPGRVRGRLRPRLVQADAPRHGPDPALPRPARSRRRRCSGRTRSPRSTTTLVGADDVAALKAQILASGLSVSQLVSTAWASASTFRGSDKRGGANGARIRLEPQSGWEVNDPDELAQVLRTLEGIQESFNAAGGSAGLAGRPDRARRLRRASSRRPRTPGYDVEVPFTPGRTDASQEQTDVESFAALEPTADGFRNYLGKGHRLPAEYLLIDRANLLTLSAPEMTVLVGGLRVLGANAEQSHARRAHRDARVADQRLLREPARPGHDVDVDDRATRRPSRAATPPPARSTWTGSRVDLVFGSNSELRALAEVYASDDAQEKFVRRLRRRVGQGHEPRPVRRKLIIPMNCDVQVCPRRPTWTSQFHAPVGLFVGVPETHPGAGPPAGTACLCLGLAPMPPRSSPMRHAGRRRTTRHQPPSRRRVVGAAVSPRYR